MFSALEIITPLWLPLIKLSLIVHSLTTPVAFCWNPPILNPVTVLSVNIFFSTIIFLTGYLSFFSSEPISIPYCDSSIVFW